jgi:membrane protein involved in colicin uptake
MAGKDQQQETEEEKAEREAAEEKAFADRVAKVVGPIINKAVTSHVSRAQKATDAKFDQIIAKLGGGKSADGESGEGEGAGGGGPGGAG